MVDWNSWSRELQGEESVLLLECRGVLGKPTRQLAIKSRWYGSMVGSVQIPKVELQTESRSFVRSLDVQSTIRTTSSFPMPPPSQFQLLLTILPDASSAPHLTSPAIQTVNIYLTYGTGSNLCCRKCSTCARHLLAALIL